MKDSYVAVILEEVRDQYKVLREEYGSLKGLPAKVDKLIEDMAEVKVDIKIIKAVLKDTNEQVQDHEQRITRLETA